MSFVCASPTRLKHENSGFFARSLELSSGTVTHKVKAMSIKLFLTVHGGQLFFFNLKSTFEKLNQFDPLKHCLNCLCGIPMHGISLLTLFIRRVDFLN